MAEPRTTVVVPVWDQPYVSLLGEAVASARDQGSQIAILIVDNASDVEVPPLDGTRVIRSPSRLSRGAARNAGLAKVTTEFVLFLDADDLLIAGTIPRLEAALDGAPEVSACSTTLLEGEYGHVHPIGRHPVPRPFVPAFSRLKRTFLLATSVWPLFSTHGTLIRTGALRDQAYADQDSGEDWPLAISLTLRGVEVLRDPGVIYRRPAVEAQRTIDLQQIGAVAVRARIRQDPQMPGWMRALLPAIWLGQHMAVHAVRPAVRTAAKLRRQAQD